MIEVTTSALDDGRVLVRSGGRTFTVGERTNIGQEGADFCPIELLLASLGS